jgi:hypothetical protein
MARKSAVFGLYATPVIAENAVDHLLEVGFKNSDISVLLPDDDGTRAFAHQKHSKAPEGTTAGAATGGAIGGTLGLLAGIGALAIPGVGPFIAAGPIIGALAGLGAGGAVGGIVGALVGMGIPEYEAKRFEGAVREGGTLLSVHCETSAEVTRAKQAMKETGGHAIASSVEEASELGDEASDELRIAYLKEGMVETDAHEFDEGSPRGDETDDELRNAYLREDLRRDGVNDPADERVRTESVSAGPASVTPDEPALTMDHVLHEGDFVVAGNVERDRNRPPS